MPPLAVHSPRSSIGPALLVCVGVFAAAGLFASFAVPFPSPYDELQHLSFMKALRDAPTLFPAYGTYRVLANDLTDWTATANYIAHPPLFYLLLAPLADHVPLLRAVNLAFAVAGFALCAQAGVSLLATTGQRIAFLAVLLLFSKPALIAGLINNDNLVLLETGLVFHLLARSAATHENDSGRAVVSREDVATALLLGAVGWTKFNAFVGLALWVGLVHVLAAARGRERLFGPRVLALAAGVLAGAIPTIHNLLAFGATSYVPVEFLFVAPAARPPLDFAAFAAAFFGKIGSKLFYVDGVMELAPAAVAAALVACSAVAAPPSRAREIAVGALGATLAFAMLHLLYGWTSFRALGSMSDAQSRYYVMLWPGFSLAVVLGATKLRDLLAGRAAARRAAA